MAWTTPRTWVNGETPDQTMMNTHIRDNLNALNDRNKQRVLYSSGTGSSPFNNGLTLTWTSPGSAGIASSSISSAVLDIDSLVAFGGGTLPQWRVSFAFNVVTICPGSPSAVSIYCNYQTVMTVGSSAAPESAWNILGANMPFTNSVGPKATQTSWANLPWSSGVRMLKFSAYVNRTGGTAGGEVTAWWIVEVRNP